MTMTINIQKSKFCIKQVKYLGYTVENGTLRVDPDKVSSVVIYPPATSGKQLRRYLGMTGWYRPFVNNFAAITTPLIELLKADRGFKWNEEAQLLIF